MAESGVSGLTAGQAGAIIELDGAPLDILTSDAGKLGIDIYSMPRPPTASGIINAFTLKDRPVEVRGDHTLTVKFINVSGGDLTIAAATDQYLTALVVYERAD